MITLICFLILRRFYPELLDSLLGTRFFVFFFRYLQLSPSRVLSKELPKQPAGWVSSESL